MPINPDDQSTWTLEQFLEHGSTAELEEHLANTGPDALSRNEAERVAEAWTLEQLLEHGSTAELEEHLANTGLSRNEAERVAEELERRRAPAPGLEIATARTALEIVQAMHAMTEATPWQPGDVELDDELELIAGAVHLLARRAVERRRELEENPLRHVGSAAAELAEIRRRFGINVARLITEGTES